MELKNVEMIRNYCCLELVLAVEDGHLTEVVSGIVISPETGSDKPMASFCPFCGSEIKYTGTNGNHNWNAKTGAE